MTPAIIFVPNERMVTSWHRLCAERCMQLSYDVIAVASRWEDVIEQLTHHPTAVVVTGRRDMIPRLEILTEQPKDVPDSQRRPQRVRRAS